MEEKGISPLIATVLLIGFTVALAAIIVVWLGDYFRDITGKSECDSKTQMACTEVDFKITDVTCGTGIVDVTIDNRASVEIASLVFRVYSETSATPPVEDVTVTGDMDLVIDTNLDPLKAFNIGTYKVGDYETSGTTTLAGDISGNKVTKVEAIPEIKVEDCEPKFCDQIIKETTNGCIVK